MIDIFQSTLPVGGATFLRVIIEKRSNISIHAPRGGSDSTGKNSAASAKDFNPRSPWGERLAIRHTADVGIVFQSTLPVGGATPDALYLYVCFTYFNPRSPWGERLNGKLVKRIFSVFQSTLPVGGATKKL